MTTPTEIPKVYPPHEIEGRWYPYWERNGFFRPEIQGRADAPVFSMVIPPPNVTGYLHMGHALNHTLQDLLARWRRMHGDRVLWLPGTDHAGIATQMVVERQLAEKGIRRQDLGREEFVARVWQWKEHSGGTMQKQMRILGESVDWSRERFTLDDGLSAAVREVFVQLYDQNLIYRGEYMINWSPGLQTAISDLEVEMKPVKGKLYHVAYPVEEAGGQGSVVSEDLKEAYESANEGERQRRSGLLRTGHGDFVVVVTTRPETMLGDTAVAFHPEDERYQELAGKQALLPLVGRRLPFIRDPVVEREFGTGLVKVTPAHDPNDFAMGRRHQLEFVTVIGKDARMTGAAPEKYRGLDRFEARKAVVAELEATGLLLKVEDYAHNVGHCQRSGTIVEPLVSTQWFVRMKPLAEPAIEAVRSGKTRFVPEHWAKVYFDWLERIEDWCISRQLWWGHRIPAWYDQEGRIVVARDEEEARARHLELTGDRSMGLRQDEDVLDTWFSSALWPFSTLGWPRPTEDLKTYYPTSVMITGPDIIFFWVARMMMTGLKFMGDVPFRKVYINSIVVDPEGKKMSKTKGNTVDPLDVFEKYGTDAVRFTLSAGASPGTNISLQPAKLETNRNFANKIWNASRFVLMNSEGARYNLQAFDRDDLAVYDRWILLRLHQTIASVDEALGEFRFHEAAATIYHFFWDEFCDWYIECSKPDITSRKVDACERIILVLEASLRLLHPFMPFITEEIWQRLPHPPAHGDLPATITLAPYPDEAFLKRFKEKVDHQVSPEEFEKTIRGGTPAYKMWKFAIGDMEFLTALISRIRDFRGFLEIPPSSRCELELFAVTGWPETEWDTRHLLEENLSLVERLAGLSSVVWADHPGKFRPGARGSVGQVEFNLLAEGVDLQKVRTRLQQILEKERAEHQQLERRHNNPDFQAKADEDVRTTTWAKLELLKGSIATKMKVLDSLPNHP